MFYVCRQGRENQREMKKDTFSLASDGSGREFVYQKLDEADKNHKENATPDDTIGEGRMYSTGSSTCPVASFRKYIAKLHPDIKDLWQRPLENFRSSATWYCKSPIGKNTLCNMMPKISKQAGLSIIHIPIIGYSPWARK